MPQKPYSYNEQNLRCDCIREKRLCNFSWNWVHQYSAKFSNGKQNATGGKTQNSEINLQIALNASIILFMIIIANNMQISNGKPGKENATGRKSRNSGITLKTALNASIYYHNHCQQNANSRRNLLISFDKIYFSWEKKLVCKKYIIECFCNTLPLECPI